jgi:hypothetical protein
VVAERGEVAGRVAGADAGGILPECDITDIVDAVLDGAPVAADQGCEPGASARSGGRLVMASAAAEETRVPARSRTYRSIRMAWTAYGNRPAGTGRARAVRVSSRPWPRSRVNQTRGTSSHGSASSASNSLGWLSLTAVNR